MKSNPTFARRSTKTELANRLSRKQDEASALREAISEFLTWYDFGSTGHDQNYQEQVDDSLRRLRRAVKTVA